MEPLRQTQKKYGTRALILAIGAGLVFILADHKPVGKGLVLGTVFSIMNFVIMGETLPMRLGQTKKKTLFVSAGSILARYVLLAVPIILAIKLEQFNLFSVIGGIFMVQIVILADHLTGHTSAMRGKQL
jgi:hypothetical protein